MVSVRLNVSRLAPVLLLVAIAPLAACEGCPAQRPASAPGTEDHAAAMTVAERLGQWDFATLIETAPVPLHGGGEIGIRAADCAACHQDIHREWSQSTHAAAMRDPQFIAELAKHDSPRWLCVSCHAPLQDQHPVRLQSDTLLLGATDTALGNPEPVPHPGFDPALAEEAVTCASCHVRLYEDGRGTILGARGDTDAPHRVTVDAASLRNACARCHTPGEGLLTPTFPCWFETDAELAAGPHADRDCASCHMPGTHRPIALGSPPRDTVHHFWAGGGVPKDFPGYETLLDRGWHPGFSATVGPPRAAADGTRVRLDLHNDRAGHAVPTADPERHLRIHVRLESADGRLLDHATHRIGQEWHWGDSLRNDPARRLDDNRLAPGERRELSFTLADAPEDASVVVEILHVRLAPENLRYARATPIDDDLLRHRADAAEVVAELERHYPSFTYVFAERWPVGGGPPVRASLAELVERSAAAQEWTVTDLEQAIDGSGGRALPPP